MTNSLKIKMLIGFVAVLILGAGVLWYPSNYQPPKVMAINSCEDFSPKGLTLSEGDEVTFVNRDSFDHKLVLGGEEVNVVAGQSLKIPVSFAPGAATYSIDCDGRSSGGSIIVSSSTETATSSTASFWVTYDLMPIPVQACVKAALGEEFNKAYADSSYAISSAVAEKFSKCSPPEPREGQVSFKSFYDGEPVAMQACLKTALGDEFDKTYVDPNYQPDGDRPVKINTCLNNN